jgi:hypothetical protein
VQPVAGVDHRVHGGADGGVLVVPYQHDGAVEPLVSGVEQADVIAFAETAPFALSTAGHDCAVDQPGPVYGPVAGLPSDQYLPGAFAGDRDDRVRPRVPRSGLGWAQRLTGLVIEGQSRLPIRRYHYRSVTSPCAGRDRGLVAFDRPMLRNLHRPAEAVHEVRGTAQRVPDSDPAVDQIRDPSQSPPLIPRDAGPPQGLVQQRGQFPQLILVSATDSSSPILPTTSKPSSAPPRAAAPTEHGPMPETSSHDRRPGETPASA